MGDDASSPTPDEIEARLRKMQAEPGSKSSSSDQPDQGSPSMAGLGQAMRVGVELVSALVVGVGIGFGLDYLLGTKPWMMLVFFFVGAAAGMLNVWRVVSGESAPPFLSGRRMGSGEDAGKKGRDA